MCRILTKYLHQIYDSRMFLEGTFTKLQLAPLNEARRVPSEYTIRIAMPLGKHREFQNSSKIHGNYKFPSKTGRIQGIFSLTGFYHTKSYELLIFARQKKILVAQKEKKRIQPFLCHSEFLFFSSSTPFS